VGNRKEKQEIVSNPKYNFEKIWGGGIKDFMLFEYLRVVK
jgi:hypothetical protein